MQINNDQLNDLLRYLCSKDDVVQDCDEVEGKLSLSKNLAFSLYNKLQVDGYITGIKTEEDGFVSIYLKPEGRAFISTGGYNTCGSAAESYFKKVLIYLGHPDNRDKHFRFDDLLDELKVPKDFKTTIYNKLWLHPKLINGNPALKNPEIWISQKGLEKITELEEEYFSEHGMPLYPVSKEPLSVNDVCERLFQMHKNSSYSVIWTKETYRGEPENINTAKEILLQKGVIYEKTSPKGTKSTHLNPDLLEINSYKEAKRMLDEAKKGPQGHSITMRDGIAMIQSQAEGLAFNPATTPPINSKIADAIKPKRTLLSRVCSVISNNIISTIFAIIGAIVAGFILWRLGWI